MSEHPDLMEPGEFDLVGFAVGVVERGRVLPSDVKPGDVIVGLASPGLRCNGYSLARRALLERAGRRLDDPAWAGAHHTLADELMRPERDLRPRDAQAPREASTCTRSPTSRAAGSPTTSPGSCPPHADAVVRRGKWDEPRIFAEIQAAGDVADDEMAHVFNLGIGMVAVVRRGPLRLPSTRARRRSGSVDRRRGVRRPRSGKYES